MLSYSRRLSNGSSTSLYFLTNVLTFRSLVRIPYLTSISSRFIYLSPSLTTVCIADSLIYKEAPYLLPVGVLIYTPNSWSLGFFNPKLTSNLSLAPALV